MHQTTLCHHRISSNNSRGRLFPFIAQKGGDYSREGDYLREAIISNIAHWKSCPKCICFIMPLNKKNLHIKLTEHGFFKCSKFSSLINFHGLNRHLSVLLDHLSLTLDRKGIKGR